MSQKDVLHLLSNQIFRKLFVNGEQPQLISMETVIEIAINQISLTNESIIEATFNFKCTQNAKTMCGSSITPLVKIKKKIITLCSLSVLSLAKRLQIILLISRHSRLENNY